MENVLKNYKTERDGQLEFFEDFRIDYVNQPVLIDNTDGVWNGNLFEFKLNITDLNKVLFQAIKYLSKMRIKGESVPANILLVDLNKQIMYVYKSKDYFEDIHKVYIGAASTKNEGFTAGAPYAKLDLTDMSDAVKVQTLLKENSFMPIDLDEECIVGWAERYYRENPKASKGDFLGDDTGKVKIVGEIREPKHFKGLINPYLEGTNEKFKYLMDKLNDRLKKKDLGAFYTPMPYAEKACELVKMAIDRVPEGNDYIILDRCCGTGNLEQAVLDVLGEDVASHIICSTYEYYEYKVLVERLGDKVRTIIPPTEAHVEYANGCIMNADAMSEEYINNPIIKQYVDNPKCTIILFENPPYADSSASDNVVNGDRTKKAKSNRKNTFVAEQFKKQIKKFNATQSSSRELSNLFIWSGFEYYLRQPTDSYIVFSPVKYFKSIGLVKKLFLGGYAFNRKHFHATESVISCALWTHEDDITSESWPLAVYDIENDNTISCNKTIAVKSVNYPSSKYADLREFETDVETTVCCASDGYPIAGYKYKKGRKPIYNENNIGYLTAIGYPINAVNYRLTRCNTKTEIEQSFGFHLRADNYLEKLPVWCSKLFPQDNWYDKDVYFTTSDGGDAYTKDPEFLKQCLIYTCLSNQNKCLSFHGSDGRDYQNELCFDDNALALADLKKFAASKKTALNKDEQELLDIWDKILAEAKATAGYASKWNYGVYQITKELNTFQQIGTGNKKQKVYDYPELNGDLNTLRDKLKAYYKKYITPKMFEYELIK